jgi:hypothetical protein
MFNRVFQKRHFMEVEQAQPPIQFLGVYTGWTAILATPNFPVCQNGEKQ